jgi:pyruvate kinase
MPTITSYPPSPEPASPDTAKAYVTAEAGNKKQETDDSKRRTLVVATLGPASWTEEMIPKMIESGVNIFRMNCSHRRGGQFEEVYPRIRKHAKALGKKVEVLGDLQGPKFRNGEIDPSIESGIVELVTGQVIEFGIMKNDTDFTTPTRMTMAATTEQVALVEGCFVGLDILLEDGIKAMEVTEIVSKSEVKCKITRGGKHKARKGINVPDLEIQCAALTAKDVEDAEYLLQLDPPCEYICISFPQKKADIQELIDIMDRMKVPADKRPKICPKIEKPQALTNLEGIMELSQSLMVARGDLGVEMGIERCIFAQKLMIRDAKRKGLYPIINATQMMESMIENPVPTRAEAADVFNAVMDGADAVMLSGEAATGKYPCETVKAQAAIALEAESVKKFFSPALKAPQ